jgi:hypothetical protein
MENKTSKHEEKVESVLKQVVAEHQAWLDFCSGQLPEDLTKQVSDQWSALGTLVHVTSWQENALKVARKMAAGEIGEFNPNSSPAGVLHIHVDQFNEDTLVNHADWTVDQVLAWSNQVVDELCRVIRELPAEQLFGGRGPLGACMWYAMPAIIHSRGHRRAAQRNLGLEDQ